MDNNDFLEDPTQGSDGSQAEQGGTVTDPALDPGYRAENKPTTTDPPTERNSGIGSILANMRKTEESVRASVSVPAMQSADGSSADEPTTDIPHSADPPADGLSEKQIMQDVLAAVRELTDEVKQIRSQIEIRPYDASHYPSERPPGIAADAEVGDSETKTDAQSEQKKPAKKNKVLSVISSVLFYAVILATVVGAFLLRTTGNGSPFMIAGYSAANVLTSSMEDVYPKGSLIITKRVDANELKIGDDITFMVSEDSSITHRIIEITENYQGTGERVFKTQGTMNAKPDKDPVAADNVVGKVIFHSKAIGDFANFVKANWPILIFVLIVIIALITFLKWNARRTDVDEKNPSEDRSPKKGSRAKRRLRKSEEEVT